MLKLTKSEVVWEAVYRGLYGAPELDTSVYQKRVNEASSWIERVKICTKRWSVPMPLYGYWNAPQNTPPRISSRILPKCSLLRISYSTIASSTTSPKTSKFTPRQPSPILLSSTSSSFYSPCPSYLGYNTAASTSIRTCDGKEKETHRPLFCAMRT